MVILADTTSRPPDSSSPAPTVAESPVNGTASTDAVAAASQQEHVVRKLSFPALKTWGNKPLLGLMSVNGKPLGGGVRMAAEARIRGAVDGHDAGLEEIREKLLVHLREAADRMNLVAPPPSTAEAEAHEAAEDEEAALPWKLRTRRPRIMADNGSIVVDGREWSVSAATSSPLAAQKRTTRRRSEKWAAAAPPRAKFAIALTREEIDEDIYAVTGARARRRPRKRPRGVQKQLDLLFPGFWLSEISAETYRVPE